MHLELDELTEEQLESVGGGDLNGCTALAAGFASLTGFGLAAAGITTAGWGAAVGLAVYAICSTAPDGGDMVNLGDMNIA